METTEKPVINQPPQKSDSFPILLVHLGLIFFGTLIMLLLVQSTMQFIILQDRLPSDELAGKSFDELLELQKPLTVELTEDLKNDPQKVNSRYLEIVFNERPGILFWSSLTWVIAFLVPGYYFLGRRMQIPISKLEDKFGINIVGFGVIGGITVFMIVMTAGLFLHLIDYKPKNNEFQLLLFQNLKDNTTLLAWSVYSVGLVTGLVEEWFFRGMLLRHYISKGLAKEGLLITSLLFGAMHFSFDASPIIPVLLSGVGYYFGSLYLRSGNIWVPIIAHATYNSIGLVLAYFVGDKIT
ncbi:CPBP family intramembrane glutamic endopeptidase [Leptospira sp. GIMC2001]|uniref:CPBP family intramembrane glutamic endopeptidase n=1 Tax=Leptospira sp. GIMC2001 TaxID=1513297 RepID=UPI00234AAED2|nr:type II CAAX endopeptidase family protein [Leptospira sp. GIMC2001]WCL49740.1 type II CAAX endopeptidase family protein [Leptospira sp. GIMC2001]